MYSKIRVFWEGHKIWKNLPLKIWRYWVASNLKWKIFFKFCGLLSIPELYCTISNFSLWNSKPRFIFKWAVYKIYHLQRKNESTSINFKCEMSLITLLKIANFVCQCCVAFHEILKGCMNNITFSAVLTSPSLGPTWPVGLVIFDYRETWLTLYRLNIFKLV